MSEQQTETAKQEIMLRMRNACAWIEFTTASANRDISEGGRWRVDYETQAWMFQKNYEDAHRQLEKLINP